MRAIAHRGLWRTPEEKNSLGAIERGFALGFGTETDVRDDGRGGLVVSHDPPRGGEPTLDALLALASEYDLGPHSLALNVKADGLAPLIAEALALHPRVNAYVFDMSVPDMRAYLHTGVAVYGRRSEIEPVLPWRELLTGVWLDAFADDWFDLETVQQLAEDLPVCVVSPELHGRDPEPMWRLLASLGPHPRITICTDRPDELQARLGGIG